MCVSQIRASPCLGVVSAGADRSKARALRVNALAPSRAIKRALSARREEKLFAGSDQIGALARGGGQFRKDHPAILDGDPPHLIGTVDATPFLRLALPPIPFGRAHIEEASELHGADAANDLDAVVTGLPVEPDPNLGVGDLGMQRCGGADVV